MSARIRVVRQPAVQRQAMTGQPPHGLPAHLPAGETMLWQGAPAWRAFALQALHARKLALYFGVLVALCLARALSVNDAQAWFSLAALLVLGMAALALLVTFAILVSRTTTYTLTDQRIVLRIGVALSMDINLPLCSIDAAALRLRANGSGDIPLRLNGPTRMGMTLLWPHVRPWRTRSVEPMLRAVPDAQRVAVLLSRALAANAGQPVASLIDGAAPAAGVRQAVAA